MPAAACFECNAALHEVPIRGRVLHECPACGSVRARREDLNAIRKLPATAHHLLAEDPANPWTKISAQLGARVKRCPDCKSVLTRHAFGGGNVRVETCSACDSVYMQRGALAALVNETQHGVELSDDAHAALHHHRMMGAANRLGAAEAGLSTAGLVAAVLFLRLVLGLGFSTSILAGAGVIAVGLFASRRWRLARERTEAEAQMQRIADAEVFRIEQKKRKEAGRGAASKEHSP